VTPLELHAQGLTRQEIADRLGLSLRAVRAALKGAPAIHKGGRPKGRRQTEGVLLRFSPEELTRLKARAGDRPLAAWCREALLSLAGEP
jgi:transcriptional regulator with XRE-family HTH domain